jgi:hypothetical protein
MEGREDKCCDCERANEIGERRNALIGTLLAVYFRHVYSFFLKMVAAISSETLISRQLYITYETTVISGQEGYLRSQLDIHFHFQKTGTSEEEGIGKKGIINLESVGKNHGETVNKTAHEETSKHLKVCDVASKF